MAKKRRTKRANNSSKARIDRLMKKRLEEEKYIEDNSKKIIGIIIISILLFIAFLLIRPFIISILTAAILSYLFYPIYKKLKQKTKKPNLSALLVCLGIIFLIISLVIFTTQFAINELVDFYAYTQTHDITAPIKSVLLKVFPSDASSYQLTSLIENIIEKGTEYVFDLASKAIVNIPMIILQMFIIFFVMFYFLMEGNTLIKYINNLLPFKENVRKRFLERFKIIIRGFVHGTILVGLIQGTFAGIAFYLLGVPQPFILTMLAIVAAVIPLLGAWVVWFPVSIGLLISGSTATGLGLLIYGTIFVSYIDNFIRPIIVGRMIKMSNVIVLLGMLGGLQLFGFIGLILGPIVLDSVIIIIDIYKSKQVKIKKR